MTASKPFLIGVVGPCGAGKSTLTDALDSLGYSTRHIAQEHSYVKDMWKRITNPDVLIFLAGILPGHTPAQKQNDPLDGSRLRRATAPSCTCPEHADLIIDTDNLSIQEVLEQALTFIKKATS